METTMTRNKNKHKTKIDWDLNVFCPDQSLGVAPYWDHDLWKINARIYTENYIIDTDYTITLLEKEARALGLVDFAKTDPAKMEEVIFDDWLDLGLDGMISLHYFNELYRDKCSDRILEFIDTLPQYMEDLPERMIY